MSTCRPADLIHANTSLYPYRSLYIQYYIYDKPCMRGRSACCISSFVEMGPPVQEKRVFEGFLIYRGVAAILVM